VAWVRGKHAFKFGVEFRINRDTTYFGISPNGEYDFGGGTAYATEAIPSQSGTHNINPGDPLPDTLSGFLSGSSFVYTVALAPSFISGGQHIGPAAISRNDVNAYAQDTWKVTPDLHARLRHSLGALHAHHGARPPHGGFQVIDGQQQYVVNPQPGYRTDWKAWAPRIQASWQATPNSPRMPAASHHHPAQYLAGQLPHRLHAVCHLSAPALASVFPIRYGFQITPSQLAPTYTPQGANIFASGQPSPLPANTVMDVNRFEQDMAALTPGRVCQRAEPQRHRSRLRQRHALHLDAGPGAQARQPDGRRGLRGHSAEKLPRYSFPNAYPGATPAFAPHTQFDSAGNVIGGFGVENVITDDAHSSYHALQTSLSGTMGHGGPGVQASYTWSKSIDTTA
jgi:hypothetical protein